LVASLSGSVRGKVVDDVEIEVCVCGYEPCTICQTWSAAPADRSEAERTLANKDVLPASTGPTSNTFAGPPLRDDFLDPVVTVSHVSLDSKSHAGQSWRGHSRYTNNRRTTNPAMAVKTFGSVKRSLLSENFEF
jgi:hypothetical protein